MPSTLENSKFKQVNFILFITSFYIVSLMITSADKGKNLYDFHLINHKGQITSMLKLR